MSFCHYISCHVFPISNRNSLHGYIHKLRRALSLDPSVSIINQRGFGYMLTLRTYA